MNDLQNFGGLEAAFCDRATARVALLPIPYEASTTHLKGTRHGPGALLKASRALEFYDEELDQEPYRVGIHTCPALGLPQRPGEKALHHIERVADGLLAEGKFLVSLGGEHTVTVGLVRAFARHYPELKVIQLDAHADLRDQYMGSPYNHACTMRRVLEICPAILMGVRSLDRQEIDYARHQGLPLYFDLAIRGDPSWLEEAVGEIGGPVYLTLDLDVMDPALMPSVGTPEPGGLGWYDLLSILRRIFERCQVVGADLVELCPRPGQEAADFVAAKLLYKLIGYRYALGGRSFGDRSA